VYVLNVHYGESNARSLDHTWAGPGLGGAYCAPAKIHPLLSAPVSIEQDESAVVTLVIDVDPISEDESNPADPCLLKIDLLTPKFELMPTVASVTVSVHRGGEYVGRWLFAPADVGTYEMAFTVNTCFGVIGVSVMSPLGLPPKIAALVALLSTAIVALITSMINFAPSALRFLYKRVWPHIWRLVSRIPKNRPSTT
jgi:hypothetical protein